MEESSLLSTSRRLFVLSTVSPLPVHSRGHQPRHRRPERAGLLLMRPVRENAILAVLDRLQVGRRPRVCEDADRVDGIVPEPRHRQGSRLTERGQFAVRRRSAESGPAEIPAARHVALGGPASDAESGDPDVHRKADSTERRCATGIRRNARTGVTLRPRRRSVRRAGQRRNRASSPVQNGGWNLEPAHPGQRTPRASGSRWCAVRRRRSRLRRSKRDQGSVL